MTAKQIVKKVRFEIFDYNILNLIESDFNLKDIKKEETRILFNYNQNKSVFEVSQYYVI